MKIRRRELNIFSISALDLFASGMGAFVLLALIAMPFFPNTGDSKERIEDLRGEMEAAKARAQDLEDVMARLQQSSDMAAAMASELQLALQQIEEMRTQVQSLQQQLAEAADRSREDALVQQLADAQQALQRAESRAQSLEAAQRELRLPHLDIVICLDVTGSMADQIEGLKQEIASLADVLDRLAPSVGFGLVAFGDRSWQRPMHEFPITSTDNIGRIQSFVSTLTPNMRDSFYMRNLDDPEAVTTAVEIAVGMSWRQESEDRYVIVITDNAAYPERISAALQTASAFASQENHYVSTVRANFARGPVEREAALTFLRSLADAGRGKFVDAAGGESMLSTILLAILD